MGSKWYGSVQNRLQENKMFCEEITVGMGVTEYSWSDRHPYEVVEVIDQKHVKIRPLDHKMAGEPYSNDWELISNESNPVYLLVRRGKYWYNGTVSKGNRMNVSFGIADYYYDYSF